VASGSTASANGRRTGVIRGVSILLILVALLVIIRALPVDRAIELLKTKVEGLGFWGPLVLGVVYVLASLAFVPGSALTLAAAAVFGLFWGTVTVSLASTISAALAFLIARYLARDKVARQADRYPKFKAIDGAIGEGGWKIIALLRLSPAVPFSLGNYLYGLTAIRFWPYVLASWAFMLPGTFMYVYLGHIGAEGVRTAAGAEREKTPAEWAVLAVGLVATIAVTVYVTHLSRKALREQTQIEDQTMDRREGGELSNQGDGSGQGWSWGTSLLSLSALVMLALAACTYHWRGDLRSLFGPVSVTLHEAYQRKADGPTFDHSAFDVLLGKYVDKDGWVDYAGLAGRVDALDAYIASLEKAPFSDLGRDEKLAFLINAYNAFTLRLILDYYPLKSIKEIPGAKRWDAKRWHLASKTLSLNEIEHEQIRPKFSEPRVHFALVCAAIGCPKLRNEAYRGDRIEAQLEDQTRYVHSHDRWFRYRSGSRTVSLTQLYNWYGSDFRQVAGSVLEFAARYSQPLKAALKRGVKLQINWLDYDWTLNDRNNKK